jgi:DNA repair ATPase RecN
VRLEAPVYDLHVLRRLRIENLVLIREAELELDAGLVALTGETGAGKTIVTQAIGLLLGAKGDGASVRRVRCSAPTNASRRSSW